MDKEKFFKQLSTEALVTEKTARRVYYSMLRLFTRQLRASYRALMPDLGVFTIKEYKPRRIGMVRTGEVITIHPKVLTYDADYKLKEHVKKICEDKTLDS